MFGRLKKSLSGLIFFIWCIVNIHAKDNNVCSTLADYNFIKTSKNCWYNSDIDLTVPEMIRKYGYPLEIHNITTADGYILQVFRIPHGINFIKKEKEILQPVLLSHGFIASAAQWVMTGNTSLGFIMADEGYDVWIMNYRGSTYGKGHVRLSIDDPKYWDYSFTEMALYDNPAVLDHIYDKTGRDDIIVIGHSQGTTVQVIYAADMPEHARNRVKFFVYLGPAAFYKTIGSPVRLSLLITDVIEKYLENYGSLEILSSDEFLVRLFKSFCSHRGIRVLVCQSLLFMFTGFDFKNMPPELIPVLFAHFPAGSSLKLWAHSSQVAISDNLFKYDYGEELNRKYYQSVSPPVFNISRNNIPGLIVYGPNDLLTTEEDGVMLQRALSGNNILYKIKDNYYNHIDFYIAKNVVNKLFNYMLSVLRKYKKTTKL